MSDIGNMFFMLLMLGVGVALVAGMWKVFAKAGQPGWGCLIPIYNLVLLVRIAGKPGIWVLLAFIPVVNFVICILLAIEVAKKFGRGAGFGVGLAFLPMIFYPIRGFGDARYQGGMALRQGA
jgi:uncharacterized membrane protein YoaK (UPF0700 family)